MAVIDIVKIQRPLSSNVSMTEIMVYNRDRSVQWSGEAPEVFKAMGDRYKMYAKVHFFGGTIVIDEILEDQPW